MKIATVTDIAAALGLTERAIRKRAQAWEPTGERVQGGGNTYDITTLNLDSKQITAIKRYLKSKQIPAIPALREAASVPAICAAPAPLAMEKLPDWQRICADARLPILRLLKQAIDNGHRVKPAIDKIIAAATNGEMPQLQQLIPMANARSGKAGSRTLSPRTVLRWWSDWKASGFQIQALVPDNERQERTEPAWAKAFLQGWGKPQKPALTAVLTELEKSLPPYIAMPTYDQARRYLQKIGCLDRNHGRMTGNELSTLKPYRRRLTDHMYPGDAYTADGHCFDGEVAHPYHGRPFRPEITPVLDIASRLCVGWSCDLAESGLAVLDALRSACENFAVPVIFYTDNGSGYKNQMLTAPGTGILHRLGITPEYSRPRNPQAHGLSERAHQTILIKAAKELCTYMGKAMDNDARRIAYKETRQAMRAGEKSDFLIEWDDFVEHINHAIADYNNTPHSGLPAYRDPATRKRVHFTPAQYWQMGIKRAHAELDSADRPAPAADLPDLYHPAEERTINRGQIQLGTLRDGRPKIYFSNDLKHRHGERVQVAYSPSCADRIWVRELQSGRLIAVAQLDGNADPYFAPSKIEESRIRRGNARLKRLENHAEEVRLEMYGPKRTIIPEPTPEMIAGKARLIAAEPAAAIANVITLQLPQPEPAKEFIIPTDEREKYKLWCGLEGCLDRGLELTEDEQRFYENFKRSAIWKAYKRYGK